MKFTAEIEAVIAQYFDAVPEGSTRVRHSISEPLLREFLQVFSAKIGRDAYDLGHKAAKGNSHD